MSGDRESRAWIALSHCPDGAGTVVQVQREVARRGKPMSQGRAKVALAALTEVGLVRRFGDDHWVHLPVLDVKARVELLRAAGRVSKRLRDDGAFGWSTFRRP